MPALLLQKPCYKSKANLHSECLQRRLNLWFAGDFDSLVIEARTLQAKMPNFNSTGSPGQIVCKIIVKGKVHAAIRMLDDENSGGILNLTDQTLQSQVKTPRLCSIERLSTDER